MWFIKVEFRNTFLKTLQIQVFLMFTTQKTFDLDNANLYWFKKKVLSVLCCVFLHFSTKGSEICEIPQAMGKLIQSKYKG